MNKIKELFFGSKQDKLTDKAFTQSIAVSVISILVCVVALCSSTWAWFTASVAGEDNQIKMADACLLSVTVTSSGEALENIESGVALTAGESYTLTISLPANSASGYCLIQTQERDYHTEYIARHEGETQTRTFTVTVDETQTVAFIARWGIYASECDVADGETLHISAPQS